MNNTNYKYSIFYLFFFSFTLLMLGCKNNSYTPGSYDSALDDITKGVYFGMEKQDFFTHCWDMNQEGQTHHGTIANMVMYHDSLNFDPKVVINFYPKFVEDKIAEMPLKYYFHSWAPWNKNELQQDSLQAQVVRFYERKYEVKFDTKSIREGAPVYYKFVGPLLIRVYKDLDEMIVNVDIINSAYQKVEE